MHENRGPSQSLDDLIDQDISSYEYFQSLSDDMKRDLFEFDPITFEDMQAFVARRRTMDGWAY